MDNLAPKQASTTAAVIAGVFLSVGGVLLYMVEPLYIGALAEHRNYHPTELGFLIAAEIGAMLAASVTAPLWINRVNLRHTTGLSILALIAGNAISPYMDSYVSLMSARLVTGFFGAGISYTIAIRLVASASAPERAFSFSVIAQVSYGAIALLLLPYAVTAWGPNVMFVAWAVLAAALLAVVPFIPEQLTNDTPVTGSNGASLARASTLPLLMLVMQGVWYLGLAALWAFLERLGQNMSLSSDDIGLALSAGLVVGIVASLQASWMGDRYGIQWQIPLMIFCHLMIFIALLIGLTATGFLVAMLVFNYAWNLALPYLLGAIAREDRSGRLTVLIPACQTGANMIGPAAAGLLVGHDAFENVVWFAIGCYALLMMLVVVATMVRRKAMIGRPG